jgi:hypothetical protein
MQGAHGIELPSVGAVSIMCNRSHTHALRLSEHAPRKKKGRRIDDPG